jgi:hypothetical protein
VNVRTASVALLALLLVQGCTKTVYYAVTAPHAMMADQSSCFRQCQMLHAGQTKQFLICVENCPDSEVVKEKRCNQIQFDANKYECTTMHNQTFDGVAFGLGIGFLVLLNILIIAVSVNGSGSGTP